MNIKNLMHDSNKKRKNIREKKGEMTRKKDVVGRCGKYFPSSSSKHLK